MAGDFTGNGHLDLAVADGYSGDVHGAAGQWRRHVSKPEVISLGPGPNVGRRSWRGISPATVASTWPSPSREASRKRFLGVLLGNGDGTFQVAPRSPTRWVGPAAIVAGDFTGNGHLDLAVDCRGLF